MKSVDTQNTLENIIEEKKAKKESIRKTIKPQKKVSTKNLLTLKKAKTIEDEWENSDDDESKSISDSSQKTPIIKRNSVINSSHKKSISKEKRNVYDSSYTVSSSNSDEKDDKSNFEQAYNQYFSMNKQYKIKNKRQKLLNVIKEQYDKHRQYKKNLSESKLKEVNDRKLSVSNMVTWDIEKTLTVRSIQSALKFNSSKPKSKKKTVKIHKELLEKTNKNGKRKVRAFQWAIKYNLS